MKYTLTATHQCYVAMMYNTWHYVKNKHAKHRYTDTDEVDPSYPLRYAATYGISAAQYELA